VSQLDLHSRAALFWLNNVMGAAFHTWREKCEQNRDLWRIIRRLEMKHEMEKEELLAEIERLRKLLMDRQAYKPKIADIDDDDDAKILKSLLHWTKLALARGFNKLLYELEQARHNRSIALKTMTFWLNQALARGYNSWREFYFEMIAMKRSMGFWLHRAMAQAWNTWLEWVEELHRQRLHARNAILRWQHMMLYTAFNTWRSSLTDAIRRKNAMLRAVLRWGGSELFAAFGYWRETAEKIRVAELEFRAYLTKSYDPQERSSRSRSRSPLGRDY